LVEGPLKAFVKQDIIGEMNGMVSGNKQFDDWHNRHVQLCPAGHGGAEFVHRLKRICASVPYASLDNILFRFDKDNWQSDGFICSGKLYMLDFHNIPYGSELGELARIWNFPDNVAWRDDSLLFTNSTLDVYGNTIIGSSFVICDNCDCPTIYGLPLP
jgi:hypothetical protein